MKKIIIYGYGKAYQSMKDYLDRCEIVAYADKKAKEFKMKADADLLSGYVPFILPDEISSFQYDYVAISSPGYYEQIKQQLVAENGVKEEQIISLLLFVRNDLDECRKSLVKMEKECLEKLLREEGCSSKAVVFIRCPETEPDGKRFSTANALYFVQDWKDNADETVKLYVVTHKEYGVLKDDTYTPITVGDYQKKEYIWEGSGDTISFLNKKINECTAIYWIWKNTDDEFVGITHYRRYFYNNELRCRENRLDSITAAQLLKNYDMIVYQAPVPKGETVEEELRGDLSPEAYDYGYNSLRSALEENQPEYISDYNAVLAAKECYYCNMMVAKKEVFDSYCEWLFSFLIPLAQKADVSGFDKHNSRVIGFFAERMLSVWLHHNPLRIKSLPVFVP